MLQPSRRSVIRVANTPLGGGQARRHGPCRPDGQARLLARLEPPRARPPPHRTRMRSRSAGRCAAPLAAPLLGSLCSAQAPSPHSGGGRRAAAGELRIVSLITNDSLKSPHDRVPHSVRGRRQRHRKIPHARVRCAAPPAASAAAAKAPRRCVGEPKSFTSRKITKGGQAFTPDQERGGAAGTAALAVHGMPSCPWCVQSVTHVTTAAALFSPLPTRSRLD
jgi:hypothetical protein